MPVHRPPAAQASSSGSGMPGNIRISSKTESRSFEASESVPRQILRRLRRNSSTGVRGRRYSGLNGGTGTTIRGRRKMAHNDVYVALRYAAVMHQDHAAVVRHAGHETFGRGAVMQEIAGETGFAYHSHSGPRCSKSATSPGDSMKWIESGASPGQRSHARGHPAPNRANGGSAKFADGGAEAAGARPTRRRPKKTRRKYGRRCGCAILRRKRYPPFEISPTAWIPACHMAASAASTACARCSAEKRSPPATWHRQTPQNHTVRGSPPANRRVRGGSGH